MDLTISRKSRAREAGAHKKKERFAALLQVAKLAGIGWLVTISIVVPILSGLFIDRLLGTNYIVVIGLVVGVVTASVSVWRVIKILYPQDGRGRK